MDFSYEKGRIYKLDDSGEVLCEITYPDSSDGVVTLNYTYVSDKLRGQGIAGLLMEAALEDIKKNGKKVFPRCAYAVKWFEKHPEESAVVAEKP